MNNNTRIKLSDTPMSSMMKMADGNPGAITVMTSLFKEGGEIDPQDFLGGLGQILSLDSLAIYGPRIWMFYKDVCGQNITKMIVCMRAVQLGLLPETKLNHAIDNYGEGIDVDDLHKQVCDKLEEFKKPENV